VDLLSGIKPHDRPTALSERHGHRRRVSTLSSLGFPHHRLPLAFPPSPSSSPLKCHRSRALSLLEAPGRVNPVPPSGELTHYRHAFPSTTCTCRHLTPISPLGAAVSPQPAWSRPHRLTLATLVRAIVASLAAASALDHCCAGVIEKYIF
jgi:hypothetical protein